jgi:hypothetical protein
MGTAQELRKLEARIMLENDDESPAVQCTLCWAALVCLRVWVNGIPLWSIWQIQHPYHFSCLETCSYWIPRTNILFIILPVHLKLVSNHPWMLPIYTNRIVFLHINDLSLGGFPTPKKRCLSRSLRGGRSTVTMPTYAPYSASSR